LSGNTIAARALHAAGRMPEVCMGARNFRPSGGPGTRPV
jgi:hypothetical protein